MTSSAAQPGSGNRNTPASRRAVQVAAAKALVVINERLGEQTDPRIQALARTGS